MLSRLLLLVSSVVVGALRTPLSRRGTLNGAVAALTLPPMAHVCPASAFAGEGTMSQAEVLKKAEKLTNFEKAVSLSAQTERAFTGKTTNGYGWDNKSKGKYVGAISGAPVFESATKYDSGTGWPSFYAAVPGGVIERPDPGDLADKTRARRMGVRTEVIDAKSGAHLGHVFPDGPPPTYKRYCMNAASLTFVPGK